jgi:hypothetical protein
MVKDKSNLVLTTKTVEDVKLANGHNSCQMPAKLNVLLDLWLFVTADKNNLRMDIAVKHVQLDTSKA